MTSRNTKGIDLREACVQEALAIIETAGIEGLSLREIARRLGVSHQAPYKHFASRDHILAEVVSRAFESFAQYLDARPQTGDPVIDFESMGHAYFSYALMHPLHYRLMFGTPLPDPTQHPEMMHKARHAFALLQDGLAEMFRSRGQTVTVEVVTLDALFIWSTMHGLSTILESQALQTLGLPEEVVQAAAHHALSRIGTAIMTNATESP